MICYRDMTFCGFWEDCRNGEDCERALTEIVRKGAEFSRLPIAQFVDKPECYNKVDKGEEGE